MSPRRVLEMGGKRSDEQAVCSRQGALLLLCSLWSQAATLGQRQNVISGALAHSGRNSMRLPPWPRPEVFGRKREAGDFLDENRGGTGRLWFYQK